MAAASGLDGDQALAPQWRRHLRRCPSCAAEAAKQAAVASRLTAAARGRPLPPVDAIRLTQVALAQGGGARRSVPVRFHFVGKMALAALLVALAAILLPRRTPDAEPPVYEADGGPSAEALVESALSWGGGLLREAMLEEELQVLIQDAETLASTMADELRAPFTGIASL
jgi:signal transduction histidine kinase